MKNFQGGLFFFVSKNQIAAKYAEYIAKSIHSNVITDQQEQLIETTIEGLDSSGLARIWNILNGYDTQTFFQIGGYYKHKSNSHVLIVEGIDVSKGQISCKVFKSDRRNETANDIEVIFAESFVEYESLSGNEWSEWFKSNPSQKTKEETLFEQD